MARPGSLVAPAAPAARGWRLETAPNVAALPNGSLAAESCASASACTAVGDYENAAGVEVALAERWNGSAWRVQRLAEKTGAVLSLFTGISCSGRTCMAVGYDVDAAGDVSAIAEQWNGHRWRLLPVASLTTDNGLFAVSCTTASACTAVGVADNSAGTSLTLAERWDGSSWSVQPTPISLTPVLATLLGVSCTGPVSCTAAGAYDNSTGTSVPLVLSWDGLTWTSQDSSRAGRVDGQRLHRDLLHLGQHVHGYRELGHAVGQHGQPSRGVGQRRVGARDRSEPGRRDQHRTAGRVLRDRERLPGGRCRER